MMRTGLVLITLACAGCSALPAAPPAGAGQPVQMRLVDRLERADLALKEARLADAEQHYRQLTEEHPRLPDVWLRLGNIYVRQNQLQAAERVYLQGLRYRPKDARLWNNLALVHTKQAVQTLEASSQVLDADSPYLPRIRKFHRALLEVGSPVSDEQGAETGEVQAEISAVEPGQSDVAVSSP